MLRKIKILIALFLIWNNAEKKLGRLRFAQFIENYHTQISDPYYVEDIRFMKSFSRFYNNKK